MRILLMKRQILLGLIALIASVGMAKPKPHTNLYDKVPHSGYVGNVALEVASPGAYPGSAGGFTTTHGCMVTPKILAGIGTGYIHSFNSGKGLIPIFAEGKFFFPSQHMRRIYPHIGVRLGGQVGTQGGAGLYSQVACGIRVPFSDRLALNVEIGPQYAGKYERIGSSNTTVTYNKPFKAHGQQFSFFGRVSFEF